MKPRLWPPHMLAFASPLVTLAYLLTGPHRWYAALPWLGVHAAWVMLDDRSGKLRRTAADRPRGVAAWPFDAMLYVLVLLQVTNVVLLARMVSLGGFFRVDTVVAALNVGLNSGLSAIVVAHELIHRREPHMRLLGRLLLATVSYDHFAVEHVRGHHVRVGTPADAATARYGETLNQFLVRSVPAQLRSAWRLETTRLGDARMRLLDRRQTKNAVLHGFLAEGVVFAAIGLAFGPAALAVHALHCYNAISLLETVNYFEHWGLVRTTARVREVDSWDTEARLSYYMLVGLSRHADHHAHASRPFQELSSCDRSPKLPFGYPRMIWLSQTNNRRVRELLGTELRLRGLGPAS
jgi:alkane 1-monooxygenase